MSKPRILFYDLETTPLKAYVWGLGKQVVRHGQLDDAHDMYQIICITYCWNDNKKAKAITWVGPGHEDNELMIVEFDELVKAADITIGKNSDRFDVKHINSQRMLNDLDPMPEWSKYTDDLEKQLRKHFYLPSYGLDYISKKLGLGGKDKMEFQDWIDILERNDKKKLKKMVTYGKKDVEDTRELWNYLSRHFEPKFNAGLGSVAPACRNCGSTDVRPNGTRQSGQTVFQQYFCRNHNGYAGRAPISKKGKIGDVR